MELSSHSLESEPVPGMYAGHGVISSSRSSYLSNLLIFNFIYILVVYLFYNYIIVRVVIYRYLSNKIMTEILTGALTGVIYFKVQTRQIYHPIYKL